MSAMKVLREYKGGRGSEGEMTTPVGLIESHSFLSGSAVVIAFLYPASLPHAPCVGKGKMSCSEAH